MVDLTDLCLGMQVAGCASFAQRSLGSDDTTNRFAVRSLIFALSDRDGPVFGPDVSLFDPRAAAQHGRGPQSAHFFAVWSGSVLESFATDSGDAGQNHIFARTSATTRLRIYFDPQPNGTRSFGDGGMFTTGAPVAVYAGEGYFQMDRLDETLDIRANYAILESTPMTFNGVTVDLGALYPRMVEVSRGRESALRDPSEDADAPSPARCRDGIPSFRFSTGGTLFALT
jgi:hypothetical protein